MFYKLMIVVPCHCVPVLNLILVPVKEHLHGITLGMNDSLKGAYLSKKKSATPIDGHCGWKSRADLKFCGLTAMTKHSDMR